MLSDFKSGSAQRAYGDHGHSMDSDSSLVENSASLGIVCQFTLISSANLYKIYVPSAQ